MLHKITLGLSAFSIVLLVTGMLLANREVIPPMAGFGLFVLSGVLGLAAIIASVVVMVQTQAFHVAMIGMLGLLPLIALVAGAVDGMRHPRINDITTDIANPPQFEQALTLDANQGREMYFPEKWGGIIRKAYPDVQPLLIDRPLEDAFARVLDAAKKQKRWEVMREDPEAGVIEAVATTRIFRWKDDIVIRLTETDAGTRVDMRSKSRDGQSDLGANAKRIKKFFDAIET